MDFRLVYVESYIKQYFYYLLLPSNSSLYYTVLLIHQFSDQNHYRSLFNDRTGERMSSGMLSAAQASCFRFGTNLPN